MCVDVCCGLGEGTKDCGGELIRLAEGEEDEDDAMEMEMDEVCCGSCSRQASRVKRQGGWWLVVGSCYSWQQVQ